MVFDSPSTLICDVECFLHGIGTQTHGNTLPPKRGVGLRHTSQHPTHLVGATRALLWVVVLCSISLKAAWRHQPHSSHYHLLSCGNPCHAYACTPGHWPCPAHAALLLWSHSPPCYCGATIGSKHWTYHARICYFPRDSWGSYFD